MEKHLRITTDLVKLKMSLKSHGNVARQSISHFASRHIFNNLEESDVIENLKKQKQKTLEFQFNIDRTRNNSGCWSKRKTCLLRFSKFVLQTLSFQSWIWKCVQTLAPPPPSQPPLETIKVHCVGLSSCMLQGVGPPVAGSHLKPQQYRDLEQNLNSLGYKSIHMWPNRCESFTSARVDNRETWLASFWLSAVTWPRVLRTEKLLTLFSHHSAVNLKAVVQVFLCVKLDIGAERSVSRGRSVEHASYPGVHQRHGAHDARFPSDVQVVASADVGESVCTSRF